MLSWILPPHSSYNIQSRYITFVHCTYIFYIQKYSLYIKCIFFIVSTEDIRGEGLIMIGRDNQNFIFTPQHLYSQGSHLNKPQPKYVYSHNLYTHNVYLYISLIQFYMFCFSLVYNMRRYCILMCVGIWVSW